MRKEGRALRPGGAARRMLKPGPCVVLAVWCAAASACGSSSPAAPSSAGYDGQWSGTTSQGKPITFTVASNQKVTAITVGYAFGVCSGVNTFSGLNLDIGYPPVQPSPTPGPGFGYGSGPPDGPNYTQVSGWFTSNTTATGDVVFGGYPACGNAIGIWTATRR
jgi:hypothetical protein